MVIWDIWGWWPWSALQGLHGLSSLLLAHDARTERARILKCCHGRVTIRVWTKNYIHTYIHHHSWMNISVFPFSSFAVIPRGTHFNNFNIAASWIRSKNDHSMKLKQETPSCIWVCPRKPTGFSWFLMMFILEMTWTGGQPPIFTAGHTKP